MVRRVVAAALALSMSTLSALAQQPAAPIPLYPGAQPRSFQVEPLPPVAPAAEPAPPANPALANPALPAELSSPAAAPPAITPPAAAASAVAPATPTSAPDGRVFCGQPVTVRLAERDAISERYRPFIGVFSDASWTPTLCAALIVDNVTPEGTASIVYVFGPMSAPTPAPASGGAPGGAAGGILHGTGIIRDGALRFQNSDGSQFVFSPFYADLDGQLTTPQGQSYRTVFKKTP